MRAKGVCLVSGNVVPFPRPSRVHSWALIEAARRGYCENCWNASGPFHVHHIRPRGAGGGDEPSNLISLCWECHRKVHDGKLSLGPRRPEPPPLDLLVQAYCAQEESVEDGRWAQAAVVTVMVEGMGMKPREVSAQLGCSPAQVRELHRTFCAFPDPASRAKDVSFRHHRIAAHTEDPERWLLTAIAEGWSTRQFEEAVKGRNDPVDAETRRMERAERLLRAVRELLDEGGGPAEWLRGELGRLLFGGHPKS